jgi:hypothetical protein
MQRASKILFTSCDCTKEANEVYWLELLKATDYL